MGVQKVRRLISLSSPPHLKRVATLTCEILGTIDVINVEK